VEYTRVEATVKRHNETSKMKKVAKARRALFLLAADIFFRACVGGWGRTEEAMCDIFL